MKKRRLIEVLEQIKPLLEREVGRKTYLSYTSYITKLREYLEYEGLEGILCGEFETMHAVRFLDWALMRGLSKRTRNNYLVKTSAIFSRLVQRGDFKKNPFKGIKQIKVDEVIPKTYTPTERRRIFVYLKEVDPNIYASVLLCFYCAIRPAELLRMKIGDLDTKRGVVRLEGAQTKNHKVEQVSIPEHLLSELEGLQERMELRKHPVDFYLFGKGVKPSSRKGGANSLQYRYKQHLDLLKRHKAVRPLNELTFYSWKYTLAEELARAGYSAPEIQAHFRHESLLTTQRYTRIFGDKQDRIKGFVPR